MFGWFKKKTAVPSRETLVPRIKNLHFTAALRDMNIPADQLPHTEPLVADLLVTYAFDLPGMFQMASVTALADLGIRPEDARGLAIANLRRQLPQIGSREHGPIQQIIAGENLEACTLLAGTYWDQVAAEIPGEIVLAVPSRDVVLFCSSQSSEGITLLRAFSAEAFQQESTHGLTERLLVWQKGQWVEFHGLGA